MTGEVSLKTEKERRMALDRLIRSSCLPPTARIALLAAIAIVLTALAPVPRSLPGNLARSLGATALAQTPASKEVAGGTVIRGRLLDADGHPMEKGVVEVLRSESRGPETGTAVDSEGAFRVVAPGTGLFLLRCAGTRHQPALIPLPIEEPDSLQLEVRLPAYDYVEEWKEIRLIGSFNRFSYTQSVPMERQADGTYTARIPAPGDSVAYQLVGIEKTGQPVSGGDAAAFVYDGRGNYAALIPTADSLTVITFDPARLLRSKKSLEVKFDSAHKGFSRYQKTFDETHRLFQLYRQRYSVEQQLEALRERNLEDVLPRVQRVADSLSEEIGHFRVDELIKRAKKAKDPHERDLLLLSRLRLEGFSQEAPDAEVVREVDRRVGPLSPWWSLDADMMALEVLSEGQVRWSEELLRGALNGHPDPAVRASALLCFLSRADAAQNTEEARSLYSRMKSEFGRYPAAQYASVLFNPETKIRVGQKIPEFSFVSLDQPGGSYGSADFKGKTLLIDFWATWCGPCVGEMANLHAAWEKYKDKGLEILSLSFDRQPDRVSSFRASKWKMPWKNGFVQGGFENPMAKAFEVTSIPKPILVDGTGRILAVSRSLRGPALDRTLERYLEK